MKPDLFNQPEFVIFSTYDYAVANGSSISAASKLLGRLSAKQQLTKVVRGVWANTSHPYFTPLACVPYLLANEAGYISFLTNLHRAGILSQIPKSIQVATTGHSRINDTAVGRFEFFKLNPKLFAEGIVWSDTKLPYQIATLEKALLDTFYISTRKSKRFNVLPELDLSRELFSKKKFHALFLAYRTTSRIKAAMQLQAKKYVLT